MRHNIAHNRSCPATIARTGITRVAASVAFAFGLALGTACSDGTSPPDSGEPVVPRVSIATTPSLSMNRSSTKTVPITVSRSGGFSGAVTLAVSALPANVTVTFAPPIVAVGSTSSIATFTVAQTATFETRTVLITASGTGVTDGIALLALTISDNPVLDALGLGSIANRYTAELWVRGTTAYTTTWGTRNGTGRGNTINMWDVAGNTPMLVDSLIVASASTLGDVQVSDDGTLLVAAIESNPNGGLAIYQLSTPRTATLLVRTTGGELQYGVHTAEIARVNGVLYAFCAIDPVNGVPARLVIVSLANPAQPTVVASLVMGAPFIHDVFVRDGLLFTAEWNDGIGLWDIGGGTLGGTVAVPKRIARLATVGGQVHNAWWYHDPVTSSKRYVFVGQEGPGVIGSASTGDIHVVDISNMAAPIEVARYTVPNAGVHNFSVDEAQGLLYAAYYNGGVRVLDIRGDLGACTVTQKAPDGRCDLTLMGRERAKFTGTTPLYVWGVHWSSSGVFASDMLNGLWRIVPAER